MATDQEEAEELLEVAVAALAPPGVAEPPFSSSGRAFCLRHASTMTASKMRENQISA